MSMLSISKTVWLGEVDDHLISFNYNRTPLSQSPQPRPVIILTDHLNQRTIIPGIRRDESRLIQEIKERHQWEAALQYSVKLKQHTFSFIWRFRDDASCGSVRLLQCCTEKDSRPILKAYGKYMDYLNSCLQEGQVYLMPDREVNFNQQRYAVRPYSRNILIFRKSRTHITFIPFTSKIQRHSSHKCQDILFDAHSTTRNIDPDGQPAVESFPYSIFHKPIMLCVFSAQEVTIEDFFIAALKPLGSVRREVLSAVLYRMKKNG
ncbi:MAG: hypothetical protein AB7S77_23380 [Desulfatirhabdiaceae bacterium]